MYRWKLQYERFLDLVYDLASDIAPSGTVVFFFYLDLELFSLSYKVTCHFVTMGLMMFVIVSAAVALQKNGGRRALMLGGGFTQLGSSVGAVVMFSIVTIAKAFSGLKLEC